MECVALRRPHFTAAAGVIGFLFFSSVQHLTGCWQRAEHREPHETKIFHTSVAMTAAVFACVTLNGRRCKTTPLF